MGKLIPITAAVEKGDFIDLNFVRARGVQVARIKKLLADEWYGYAIPVEELDNSMPSGLLIYVPLNRNTEFVRDVIRGAK